MQITVLFDVVDKATKPLQGIDQNFKSIIRTMSQVQGCMRKINQASELFQRMGDTVSQLSQPFREFEQGMADLSALTGLAGDDLKRLGEIARKTGVESGLGATGATEAFKLLASQIQVDDIGLNGLIDLQKETITLSQAAGMSMADAANSMAGTINQFGLQASEANRVINVLAAGSKYGAAEIPDLAQSFKVVGAAANAAGLNIESTAGAIEVLSKNNLKGSEAGTALRNILLKMQTEMGVDFNKTSLSEALTGLKPKYKDAAYMSKLFGMENMAAVQFLVANASAVDEMTKKVTDTQTASEQAAISTDTWNHRLKVQAARFNEWSMQLTETAPGIMNIIQVGSQAMSMLTSLSPLFAGAATGIKGVIGVTGGAIGGVSKVVKAYRSLNGSLNSGLLVTYTDKVRRFGAAGRIAAAGIWLKNTAAIAWKGIGAAANAITSRAWWLTVRHAAATKLSAIWSAIHSKAQLVGSSVMSLWSKRTLIASAVQGGLTKALRVAKVALLTGVIPALVGAASTTWAWTAALLANPITWIVVGIGALVAAVVVCWQKFAEFRAVILTMWDAIKGFGQAILEWMIAPFKMAWEVVAGIGKAIGALFSGDFSGAWDSLKEGFGGAVKEFGKPIKTAVETTQNISGNYDRYLAQEQAVHSEKEKARAAGEEQAGDTAGLSGGGVPTMAGYEGMGDLDMSLISGFDPTGGMEGMLVSGIPAGNKARTGGKEQTGDMAVPRVVGYEGLDMSLFSGFDPTADMEGMLVSGIPAGNKTRTAGKEQTGDMFVPGISMGNKARTDGREQTGDMVIPRLVGYEGMGDMNMPLIPGFDPMADMGGMSVPGISAGNMVEAMNYSQNAAPNISVNFNPNINISSEMTQKSKDDLMKVLKDNVAQFARIIQDELRRSERGAYGLS